ncbi:hypothetical protein D3C81_1573000 [compost metagenome]
MHLLGLDEQRGTNAFGLQYVAFEQRHLCHRGRADQRYFVVARPQATTGRRVEIAMRLGIPP